MSSYSDFDLPVSGERQTSRNIKHGSQLSEVNPFGPIPGVVYSNNNTVLRPKERDKYYQSDVNIKRRSTISQNQRNILSSHQRNNDNLSRPSPSAAPGRIFTDDSSSTATQHSLQPRTNVYLSSSDQILSKTSNEKAGNPCMRYIKERNRTTPKNNYRNRRNSGQKRFSNCTNMTARPRKKGHNNSENFNLVQESSSESTSFGSSDCSDRGICSSEMSGKSGDDLHRFNSTPVMPPGPVEAEVNEINTKLERIDATLAQISARFNLHEDNIDELQERLCVQEYGSPGSFFTGFRFFIALLKCTLIPIIVVEVLNTVLFP